MPEKVKQLFDVNNNEIKISHLPHGVMKGNRILNASIYLFRFILKDSDPRWKIVYEYLSAKKEVGFKPLNFENALRAIYLSKEQSFRNRYTAYTSKENILQLIRAIQNLNSHNLLNEMFCKTKQTKPQQLDIEFARTNKILAGIDSQGITACPEALYQLRAFIGGKYIGRIGFNAHLEDDDFILSITNIQGVPNNPCLYDEFKQLCGIKPHNILVQQLKSFQQTNNGTTIYLRGLRNPPYKQSSAFYNALFRAEGIDRFYFNRQ